MHEILIRGMEKEERIAENLNNYRKLQEGKVT
jgi:hypothetical protein